MVRAGDLIPFVHNWRTHPDGQRKAVAASLTELGYFSPVEAWTAEDGRLVLLDGHLRQELIAADIGPETEIPVVILDLTEDEAKKAILVKDPLAGMAEANEEMLAGLLAEVDLSSDEWAEMSARLNALAWIGDAGAEEAKDDDRAYTDKIEAPVYKPNGEKPPIAAMINRDKTKELVAGIDAADLPADIKDFLRLAAERHTVFNFRQIAEFYCHAEAMLQDLMERSGLVIIDFSKAIEYGFVHLTERLGEIADIEESDGPA